MKREREKRPEKLFEEIIPEMFPPMGKETGIQVQGTQKFLNKMNSKRSSPRHIIIKIIKHQEKKNNLLHTREAP